MGLPQRVKQQIVAIPYSPREWAKAFHATMVRFIVLVLHRRAGKTVAMLNHHIRAAMDDSWERRRLLSLQPQLNERDLTILMRARKYGHIMPSYKQAKLVAWDLLKYYTAAIPGIKKNEQELSILFPNGSKIQLFGADNPDSLRGPAFSGVSFDEFSQQDPKIFGEIISKALADHLGYAIWGGTIKGKDHLYHTHKEAVGDPEWFALWQDIDRSLETETGPTISNLRKALEDDRGLVIKGVMTQAELDQEWYLSTDASIRGAYYEKELSAARESGRITVVDYDPALPVDTDWDLGIDDNMSIWFSQHTRAGQIRLIDYYENRNEGLPHYAQVLSEKRFFYGEHWAPPDIEQRELADGRTRKEAAAALGIRFKVMPRISLQDGIHAVRMILPRCYFSETKCEHGLNSLRHYRQRFNENTKEYTGSPVHDPFSHGADSFRTLAVRCQSPKDRQEREDRFEQAARANPFAGPERGHGIKGWMIR